MITAENITDVEIRQLRRGAWRDNDDALITECSLALARPGYAIMTDVVNAARARCAEILNARKDAK